MSTAALVFALAPASDAAGEAVFEVESVEASEGSSVEVRINLTSNPGLWGMQAEISYDSALTLTGIESGGIMDVTTGPFDQRPYKLYCENKVADDTTATGILVVLTFQVSPGAAGALRVSMDNFDAVSYQQMEQVECISTPGEVSVGVRVVDVVLTPDVLTLRLGERGTIVANVIPSDAANKNVRWESNNTSVATVNNGTVVAAGYGTATVSATTEDGGKVDFCLVRVVSDEVPVTGVSLNTDRVSMKIGESVTLAATVSPSNASNKNVSWSSSNTNVAAVTSSGKVTGVNNGTAVITVITEDGGKTDTCVVTVSDDPGDVRVTGVDIDRSSVSLSVGDSITLKATVSPSDATNKNVTWTSSDGSVATVNSSGTVKAVSVGKATITVTTVDGQKTDTCTVTVSESGPQPSGDNTLLYVGIAAAVLVVILIAIFVMRSRGLK